MSETIKEKLLRNQSRIDAVRRDVKAALQIIDVLNVPAEQLVEKGIGFAELEIVNDPQLGHDPKKLTEAQKREAINRYKQNIAQSLHELLDAISADIDSIVNDL